MNKILKREQLAPKIVKLVVDAPLVARSAKEGQFIITRVGEDGERIPLTIADFNREAGTVTIIVQEIGYSTQQMCALKEGEFLNDFAGPLGMQSEIPQSGRVLCIGGGVGTAVIYPQIKLLTSNKVDTYAIIGGRSKELVILEDEIRALTPNTFISTDDGSAGIKGRVTDVLAMLVEQQGLHFDHVLAVGPLIMMKVVSEATKKYGIPTTVSMNPLMVDGTGMCGCCRVTVGGKVKYACVDGPEFDGHLIDFDEAMLRSRTYCDEEKHICTCRAGGKTNG